MEEYFKVAINEAKKAKKGNEVPVGAVIVYKNKIIAKGHNNRQKKHDVLGHAEIVCIRKAEKKIKDWRLNECEMYVTLEPCELCNTIINECRLNKVYYIKTGKNNTKDSKIIKQTKVCKEVEKIYNELINSFFIKLRE